MQQTMTALVYEGPRQLSMRDVPVPVIKPDEALIQVAYSGICGSELIAYEGIHSFRKPPLIMGHEFSGTIVQIGEQAAVQFPALATGARVTANPLLTCGRCRYCMSGQAQICVERKLISSALPGSYATFVAVRADAIHLLPDQLSLTDATLVEPAAVAVHAAEIAAPRPHEIGLVIGAGPIGLLTIQALQNCGLKTIYCAELNPARLAMAESLGAIPLDGQALNDPVDLAVDAAGTAEARQRCVALTRAGGRVVWIGLHEVDSTLPMNDIVRREIKSFGSYAYNPADFAYALRLLSEGQIRLDQQWTRTEPLRCGPACFEELLHGSPISKIWLESE